MLRVRAVGGRRRHGLGGGSRIQQDSVQHEAGHSPERGSDHFPGRSQADFVPRHGPLSHSTEHQGLGRAGGGFRVPASEPGRRVHCGGDDVGRPSAAAELAGYCSASAPSSHSL